MLRSAILIAAFLIAAPAMAQNIERTDTYEYIKSQPYPVIEEDVTNKPYRVIGRVRKRMSGFSISGKSLDFSHIQKELWEIAQKMKADAVIKVQWGEERGSLWAINIYAARGLAIKFLSDAEIANLPNNDKTNSR